MLHFPTNVLSNLKKKLILSSPLNCSSFSAKKKHSISKAEKLCALVMTESIWIAHISVANSKNANFKRCNFSSQQKFSNPFFYFDLKFIQLATLSLPYSLSDNVVVWWHLVASQSPVPASFPSINADLHA